MARTRRTPDVTTATADAVIEAPVIDAPVIESPVMSADESPTLGDDITPDENTEKSELDRTVESYRSATPGEKAKIRKGLNDAMLAAVGALDIARAHEIKSIVDAIMTTPAKSATEINPADVIARRVIELRRAADMLINGEITPEGLDVSNVTDEAITAAMDKMSDESVLVEINQSATKIASAKITRSTDRRSIPEWIERAIDGVASGTFLTVAQIRTLGAVDGDDYRPSSGAISAALTRKSGAPVSGIVVEHNEKNVLGVRIA